MITHRGVSIIIIVLLVVGLAIWGPAGMRALFVPKAFFFVDNNPASIVIPEEGMVRTTTNAFPVVGPLAREMADRELNATKSVKFDLNCSATPSYNEVATDAEFKLRNGADVRRTIVIGPKAYTLRPNTTIGIVANDEGTWHIICDGIDSGSVVNIGN